MPLVVPALRILLLFINVYETFKTLRPPRRSTRHGELLPRSVSQRKRAMKGCMAVWLVWCTTVMVESLTDRTVGYVTPFYGELKGLVYLFQILTRARGAEPLYLHVLRPCVKPYVTTLDFSLEVVQNVGEILVLVALLPYHAFVSWWYPQQVEPQTGEELNGQETPSAVELSGRSLESTTGSNSAEGRATARAGKQSSRNASRPRPRSAQHRQSDTAVPSGDMNKHEIWYPPASSLADQTGALGKRRPNPRVASDPVTAKRQTTKSDAILGSDQSTAGQSSQSLPLSSAQIDSDEWRQYPPFPSAYPPTPQPSSRVLTNATTSAASSGTSLSAINEESGLASQDVSVLVEVEEWRQYPPFPSAYPATPQTKPMTIPAPIRPSNLMSVTEEGIDETSSIPPLESTVSQVDPRNLKSRSKATVSQSQSLPIRTKRKTAGDEPVSEFGTRRRRGARLDGAPPGESQAIGQDFGISLEPPRDIPEGKVVGDRNAQPKSQDSTAGDDDSKTLPRRSTRSTITARSSAKSDAMRVTQTKVVPRRQVSARRVTVTRTRRTDSTYSLATDRASRSTSVTSLTSNDEGGQVAPDQTRSLSRASSVASDGSSGSLAGTKRPRAAMKPSSRSRDTEKRLPAPPRSTSTEVVVKDGVPPLESTWNDESETLASSDDSFGEDEFVTPKPRRRIEPSTKRRRMQNTELIA